MTHYPKIDPDLAIGELCRRNFYYFLQQFIHITIPEDVVWNWHIEYICDKLQVCGQKIINREPFDKEYLIINIPPGSTKSTIVSQYWPVWLWINDQSLTMITLSHTETLAVRHAMRSRDVMVSDQFKKCFPHIKFRKDLFNKKNYGLQDGGTRIVTSVGGSITGDHGDVIIGDDLLKVDESTSEKERSNANDYIKHTLPTRKKNNDTVPTVIIMQRLHELDPVGMLLEEQPDKVDHVCLPAEESDDIEPYELIDNYVDGLLDPVRLSRQMLQAKKDVLGSTQYAGQYAQRPSPAEGSIFLKKWFKIVEAEHVPNTRKDFWIDTAYTEDEKNDPCCIICTSTSGGNLYVHNVLVKHMEFPDQVKVIPEFAKENGYSAVSIIRAEPKASGKDVVNTLKKSTKLNIKESKNPTKDKVARANDAAPSVEAGRVYLVKGGWNTAFIEECTTFPNARHDDQVDCLVMACNEIFKRSKLKFIS